MKLLEEVKTKIKFLHYSDSTAKVYVYWIKQFILFHKKRHPVEMGKLEIEQFLSYLASYRNVSASTQNQAFNALFFLYNQILELSLKDDNINALRAKQRVHLPTVLSTKEVKSIIDQFKDFIYKTIIQMIYGCGLRLSEALNLRIKNIDFELNS